MRRAMVLVGVLSVSGCHEIVRYSPEGIALDDAIPDMASDGDIASDIASDGDMDIADSGPRRLSCTAPALIVETTVDLRQPAMHIDGHTLVARSSQSFLAATRQTLNGNFSPWEDATTSFPADSHDPTFFSFDEEERAIIAVVLKKDPYLRELRYCENPSVADSCTKITVIDDQDKAIAADMDGASVGGVEGAPIMVLNVSDFNKFGSANVLLATPTTDGNLLHWRAESVPTLALPDLDEDDPSISSDGTIVIFEHEVNKDLWVAYRESLSETLSEPEPLTQVNTDDNEEHSPEIYQLNDGKIELYFVKQRDSDSQRHIFRSVCTR